MRRTDGRVRRRFFGVYGLLAAVFATTLAAPLAVAEAAEFTFVPQTPLAGQAVTFTATDVRAQDTVTWDFENDGLIDAAGTTVSHVYSTAGQRTVRMRVTRPGGQTDDKIRTIVVAAAPDPPPPPPPPPAAPANRPPVASFTFYPREPVAGDTAEFVSTSFDPESPIATHTWDLDGDGQFDDATGVSARRSFTTAGQHTVALRVTDARGAADVERRTLTVRAALTSVTPLGLMSPFPIVRIVGRATPLGAQIRILMVRNAPRGAKVTVRCRGEGCRRGRQVKYMRSGRVRFRLFERQMGTGTRMKIFVPQRGRIGKYTSFPIRRRKRPLRRDLCVTSARARPKACPSS